jgi:hypothetical protein
MARCVMPALCLVQSRIDVITLKQFAVSTFLHDTAVLHDQDAVGISMVKSR